MYIHFKLNNCSNFVKSSNILSNYIASSPNCNFSSDEPSVNCERHLEIFSEILVCYSIYTRDGKSHTVLNYYGNIKGCNIG